MRDYEQKNQCHRDNQVFFSTTRKNDAYNLKKFLPYQMGTQYSLSSTTSLKKENNPEYLIDISFICILLFIPFIWLIYRSFWKNLTDFFSTPLEKLNSNFIHKGFLINISILSLSSISIVLFLYLSIHFFTIEKINSLNLTLVSLIGVLTFYFSKKILSQLLLHIYQIPNPHKEILPLFFEFWIYIGLFSLPISLLMKYANFTILGLNNESTKEIILYISAVIAVLLYVFSLFKFSIYMLKHKIARTFHIILYICTLEFIPLILCVYTLIEAYN